MEEVLGVRYAQPAADFGVGTTIAYRYITEAIEVLDALASVPVQAARTTSTKAFVILDGMLLPIDGVAADRPFYSAKHKKHGINVQVLTDPAGCCGRHRPCPGPFTTSARPASTALSERMS
ncbi:hypothetical protein GCM10010182_81680 [Actinomadura cremea]|nr:hypothetical protein GCM10010182_81680 [Actinomadura cremea]